MRNLISWLDHWSLRERPRLGSQQVGFPVNWDSRCCLSRLLAVWRRAAKSSGPLRFSEQYSVTQCRENDSLSKCSWLDCAKRSFCWTSNAAWRTPGKGYQDRTDPLNADLPCFLFMEFFFSLLPSFFFFFSVSALSQINCRNITPNWLLLYFKPQMLI